MYFAKYGTTEQLREFLERFNPNPFYGNTWHESALSLINQRTDAPAILEILHPYLNTYQPTINSSQSSSTKSSIDFQLQSVLAQKQTHTRASREPRHVAFKLP